MSLSPFRKKRIVITGASGYLASRLIQTLSHVPCELLCVTRQSKLKWPSGGARASRTIIRGVAHHPTLWDKLFRRRVDIIFHLAAQTSVPEAKAHPGKDARINVGSMRAILGACKRSKQKPIVIYAGTATQIGWTSRARLKESFKDRPITVYDRHKLLAEKLLKAAARRGIVHGCTLRLFNVYGPGPKSSSGSRGILNQMVQKALAGEAIPLYGTGWMLRDYVYIDDVIRAFCLAALRPDRTNGFHFNIGTGKGISLSRAFEQVVEVCNRKSGRHAVLDRSHVNYKSSQIESRSYVSDSSLFRRATGWRPRVSFHRGLQLTVQFYMRKNQNG